MRDFLGTGWAFPIHIDAHGRIALARHERDIEEAIRIILLTPKGQRVMRPEFGCQIHELLFAPNNATTWGLAAYYVEEALGMWEPRIRLLSVEARPDPGDPGRLLIDIEYEIKATHDRRSLVFPFYRIPGEGESGLAEAVGQREG
ncbi:GPW/gp25 family protein [Thermogemmatispora sp.]|uniref:GPW/gp25 family protein n=1 Tax=Thermogemmatispora sp. TaxID=1968838 RepID=UPI0035E44725